MNTVGMFAGRGDVVFAIFLGMLVGCWAGWYLHKLYLWAQEKFK